MRSLHVNYESPVSAILFQPTPSLVPRSHFQHAVVVDNVQFRHRRLSRRLNGQAHGRRTVAKRRPRTGRNTWRLEGIVRHIGPVLLQLAIGLAQKGSFRDLARLARIAARLFTTVLNIGSVAASAANVFGAAVPILQQHVGTLARRQVKLASGAARTAARLVLINGKGFGG